jgi:hypothetical protein
MTQSPGPDSVKLVFRSLGKKEKVLQISSMSVKIDAGFEKAVKNLLNPLSWKVQ